MPHPLPSVSPGTTTKRTTGVVRLWRIKCGNAETFAFFSRPSFPPRQSRPQNPQSATREIPVPAASLPANIFLPVKSRSGQRRHRYPCERMELKLSTLTLEHHAGARPIGARPIPAYRTFRGDCSPEPESAGDPRPSAGAGGRG